MNFGLLLNLVLIGLSLIISRDHTQLAIYFVLLVIANNLIEININTRDL
jgi:hypothetical protein